jgi:hypothetical protein
MADRIYDLLDQDPRLSVEEIGAEDDGSPIFSVIDMDTREHYHLTLTRV